MDLLCHFLAKISASKVYKTKYLGFVDSFVTEFLKQIPRGLKSCNHSPDVLKVW